MKYEGADYLWVLEIPTTDIFIALGLQEHLCDRQLTTVTFQKISANMNSGSSLA